MHFILYLSSTFLLCGTIDNWGKKVLSGMARSLKSVLRDRHSIISVHSPLLFVFPTNNDDQDPGPHSPLRSVLAPNDSNHIFWKFIAGVAWLFETTFSICCKHNSTCKRYNLEWTLGHFECVTHTIHTYSYKTQMVLQLIA